MKVFLAQLSTVILFSYIAGNISRFWIMSSNNPIEAAIATVCVFWLGRISLSFEKQIK